MNRSLASIVLVLVASTAPGAQAASPSARAAAPSSAQALDVLVLGDSYSAGNGATGTSYGPAGCYRNSTSWSERYAAGLRETGYAVTLANHACSGGRTPDVHTPRPMDTQSGRTTPAPSGVTTTDEADAHLRATDPCNTKVFPEEEFWTYRATSVSGGSITYDCTRTLRPQADFVTADTDLVVLTMGGNDAGFSRIVQGCFVVGTRSASACRSAVGDARALVPAIKQRLLDDVAALRAHGLREDAKIVQVGYPWLQLDNGFTLPDPDAPLTPFPAGDAVRSLISDATAELATLPASANLGHPGQMTFVDGVTTAFSGHEPDAQATNPQTWVNHAFSGPDTNVWYHPNDLGQAAYARLLLAHGTFGAVAPITPPPGGTTPSATLRVRPVRHRSTRPEPVVLRVRTRLSDGTVPSGRLVVRLAGHREPVARRVLRASADGRMRLRVRGLRVGRHRLVVLYRDRLAPPVRDRVRVRVLPRRG